MPRGRPPKAEGQRKTKDLRIPVTASQKAVIDEAMELEKKRKMAAWARDLLLAAAQAIIDAAKKPKKK